MNVKATLNFDYLKTKQVELRGEELTSKHNKLRGIWDSGFRKDPKKQNNGNIEQFMEQARLKAEISKMEREMKAKKEEMEAKLQAPKKVGPPRLGPKSRPKPEPVLKRKRKDANGSSKSKKKPNPFEKFGFKIIKKS